AVKAGLRRARPRHGARHAREGALTVRAHLECGREVREDYLARTFRVGERGRRHRKRPSGPWRRSLLQFRPRASTPRTLIAVAPAANSWRTPPSHLRASARTRCERPRRRTAE